MEQSQSSPIKPIYQVFLCVAAFLLVAFGQPAWNEWISLAAGLFGYALFWRVLISYPSRRQRFLLAGLWFTSVQLVQLSWFISHPYLYIYAVYFLASIILGFQFGLLGMLLTGAQLTKIRWIIALAAFWTLMEWVRLFFFSGFSWNPVGLALTGSLYSLQAASLFGVFGLSFWVIFANLLALRAWMTGPRLATGAQWALAAILPFVYGYVHLHTHEQAMASAKQDASQHFNALLVQTAFPAEEAFQFQDTASLIAFVLDEWKQILRITKPHAGKSIDLVVLPEYVVPFGTYSFVFPYEQVKKMFIEILGEKSLKSLPPLELPLARELITKQGSFWFVNNAYLAQAMAAFFQSDLLVGFEDVEEMPTGERELYSAAIHFKHGASPEDFPAQRYSKRVLVPMAEYIPFSFCRMLAAQYGITGSFTCGKEAHVMQGKKVPFCASICYEETFGDLMREGKLGGAKLLVNLTSDVWFPNSRLPKQHFDHSRLRTVENGIPLIRACNTGITGACDSLGRVIATLGEDHAASEWLSESLYVSVPMYTFHPLYSKYGDMLIVAFSLAAVLAFLRFRDYP